MQLEFCKYEATGNDFVMIDHRDQKLSSLLTKEWIARISDRRLGVGGDGVILIEKSDQYDFSMLYFNADGLAASMCGNGARAATHFVHHHLNIKQTHYTFKTAKGVYSSQMLSEDEVKLKMSEVYDFERYKVDERSHYLYTGVPHLVVEMAHEESLDFAIEKVAPYYRYHAAFGSEGTNVNYVKIVSPQKLFVRTYERGVEAETLSCGTGVLASALVMAKKYLWSDFVDVETKGGSLRVDFDFATEAYFLSGKARQVFSGIAKI
ncbi:MAG: diaminopimelate epimerase [Oligoflexia bacterium]|nr:diaminopimelate epimerase [Oligoflexia bacterium]MBF0366409.1 diaminopimelate epimerase [Oligoflexia bacterium]